MKVSGWGLVLLVAVLFPAFLGFKRFGVGGLIIPVVILLLAYKAGAR